MVRYLRKWIDRDWERRDYNPVFAFIQRLLWGLPLAVIGAVGWMFDAGPGDPLYDWGLPIGAALSLALVAYSSYRWFVGYGRTGWQEEQARRRRD